MIQYPKNEHVTLPSVESWGTNNNIIKDPPKSIVTRRIDKVGETQNLVEWVDESGDRICEGINLYPRGVNPFVAVSYDNFSNNAGIKGNLTNISSKTQVSLPYKVMRDGVFRPPIQNQRDLLPLSRQNRLLSSQYTNPEFIDFSKTRQCDTLEQRAIKEDVIKTCIRPTAVFTLEKPIEPFNINHSIVDSPLKYNVNGTVRGFDNSVVNVLEPSKGANNINNTAFACTNLGSNGMQAKNEVNMMTNKFIQNVNYQDIISNPSLNIQTKDLREVSYLDENRYIKDALQGEFNTNMKGYEQDNNFDFNDDRYIKEKSYLDYTTPMKGVEKQNILSDHIELQRRLPTWEATTNQSDYNIYKNIEYENEIQLERNIPLTCATTNVADINTLGDIDVGSRNFKLPRVLPVGGFEGKATMPQLERNYEGESLNQERNKFNKKVFSMFEGRYAN